MSNPLYNDIRYLKGVGEKRAQLFSKLGILTVSDLINTYPRTYEDRTAIKKIADTLPEETCGIIASLITPVKEFRTKNNLTLYSFTVSDGTSEMKITLFNQKYTAAKLNMEQTYLFYGKITGSLLKREMTSPSITEISDAETEKGRIMPVYALCAGLSQNIVKDAVNTALKLLPENIEETLTDNFRKKYHLAHIRFAIENIHKPSDFYEIDAARRRLVFEELLILQLGLLHLKSRNRGAAGIVLKQTDMQPFYAKLPFTLTNAQQRATEEAKTDMCGKTPMSRLLQGDVGSGKTAVAAALAFFTAKNGCQTCMMAPTEILAKQHYNSISPLLDECRIPCALLTGSTTEKEKTSIINAASNGDISFIIGTHALIEDRVKFKNLALVITDEQHRFGVKQRALLSQKGDNPHILVMSATPIPRTLGLIMYGDLDISVLDEMPPGRQKVSTYLADGALRERVYNFALKEVKAGRQVFIVCPLVSEDDTNELKAVEGFSKEIKAKYFKDYSVGFIHGKLKGNVKDKIMQDFSENKVNVLVATTVIEVGIDIPNASVMLIENAERYGLSQLHQLRGRVGRGENKSYCVLLSDSENEATINRLQVLCSTNDGFKISEKDLEIRGPGDFFGEKQHGLPPLKIANIFTDIKVLKESQTAAKEIMEKDFYLEKEENFNLKQSVKKLFSQYDLNIFN